MPSQVWRILLVFIACLIAGVGFVFYLHVMADTLFPIGVDFYPRWVGAQAFWSGQSPYSEAVTAESQRLVYVNQNLPANNTFAFYYPAHLAVLILPFVVLPLDLAGILWSATMWALLATAYLLWVGNLHPRPTPKWAGVLLASLLLFRPSVIGSLSGQFPPLALTGLLACWWLISIGAGGLAGLVLLLATVKPSLALLPVLVILVWSVRWRQWHTIIGFIAGGLLLALITFNRIGWWIPDWLHQLFAYGNDSQGFGLAWSPAQIWTPLGLMWLFGTLILSVIGAFSLWQRRAFPWLAVFAGSSLNLLVSPHVYDYDLLILLSILFWLGVQWPSHNGYRLIWLLLVSVPLLLLVLSVLVSGDLTLYMGSIWLFYPNLLLWTLIVWHARGWWQYRRIGMLSSSKGLEAP